MNMKMCFDPWWEYENTDANKGYIEEERKLRIRRNGKKNKRMQGFTHLKEPLPCYLGMSEKLPEL